jgi:hypothetical protein
VAPKSSVYFVRIRTGLRAIARESAKERNRETTGIDVGNLTPRFPDYCSELKAISWGLLDAFG